MNRPTPPTMTPPRRSVTAALTEYGLVALLSGVLAIMGYLWWRPSEVQVLAEQAVTMAVDHTRAAADRVVELGPAALQSPTWYEDLVAGDPEQELLPAFEPPSPSGAVWARDSSRVYFQNVGSVVKAAPTPLYAVRLSACPGWDPRLAGEDHWVVWWRGAEGAPPITQLIAVHPENEREALLAQLEGALYLNLLHH